MAIIRIFFVVLVLFVVMIALLSALAWIKIRSYLRNPFMKSHSTTYERTSHDRVIEGEYTVIHDPSKTGGEH